VLITFDAEFVVQLEDCQRRYGALEEKYNRAKVAMKEAHVRLEANQRRKADTHRALSSQNQQDFIEQCNETIIIYIRIIACQFVSNVVVVIMGYVIEGAPPLSSTIGKY